MATNNRIKSQKKFFCMMLNGVLIYGMLGRFFGPLSCWALFKTNP
jgi:hypothetical protein